MTVRSRNFVLKETSPHLCLSRCWWKIYLASTWAGSHERPWMWPLLCPPFDESPCRFLFTQVCCSTCRKRHIVLRRAPAQSACCPSGSSQWIINQLLVELTQKLRMLIPPKIAWPFSPFNRSLPSTCVWPARVPTLIWAVQATLISRNRVDPNAQGVHQQQTATAGMAPVPLVLTLLVPPRSSW